MINSKQEYLDLLIKTSSEGKFPALNYDKECAYRTFDDRKCAFGLLIEDKDYLESMEGRIVSGLVSDFPKVIPNWLKQADGSMTENDIKELNIVQSIHDEYGSKSWNHTEFVTKLLRCKFFEGIIPSLLC